MQYSDEFKKACMTVFASRGEPAIKDMQEINIQFKDYETDPKLLKERLESAANEPSVPARDDLIEKLTRELDARIKIFGNGRTENSVDRLSKQCGA